MVHLNGSLRRHLLAAGFYVVSTLVMYWPVVFNLSFSVLGTFSDGTSTIRDYSAFERQGGTPFTLEHDALVNAPEGLALSPGVQVANSIQPLFVWALHYPLGFVAAWNIFILVGLALSGYATFVLLERLGVHPLAALFGGHVFALSGYLVEKAFVGHGGLVHAWVLPVVALALLRLHRNPTIRSAAIVGAALGLAFYAHSYYGLIAGFFVTVFIVVKIVLGRDRLWHFTLFDVSLATAGLLLLPAFTVLFLQNTPIEPTTLHSVTALQQFGARIPAYLTPNERNPFLGALVPRDLEKHLEGSGEPSLFFGFTTLVLAGAWLIVLRRRTPQPLRGIGLFAAVVGAAAFVMSLPRLLDVGPAAIPMPSWFIGHVSTFWRVYARFGVLVGLALAVLAALALHVLIQRYGRRVAVIAIVLATVELLPGLPPESLATNEATASSRWLSAHPSGIVIHYPQPTSELEEALLNGREYFYQTHHWHPLYSSTSLNLPRRSRYVRWLTRYVNRSPTPGLLAAERVRYVVLHDDVYRTIGQRPPILRRGFRQVGRAGQSRIFEVTARPANVDKVIARRRESLGSMLGLPRLVPRPISGFYGPERWKGQANWRWVGQDAKMFFRVPLETVAYSLQAVAFSALEKPRILTIYTDTGRLIGRAKVESSETKIKFGPLRLREGVQTLRLHTEPGPEQLHATDPRVASIYISPVQLVPLADLG